MLLGQEPMPTNLRSFLLSRFGSALVLLGMALTTASCGDPKEDTDTSAEPTVDVADDLVSDVILDDALVDGSRVEDVPPAPSCESDADCKADDSPCIKSSCAPSKTCESVPLPEGTSCSDGDPCTEDDACNSDGACESKVAATCDDGNLCTSDICDKVDGCVHGAKGGPCTDGDACTQGDSCSAGQCVPGSALDCDDDNPCTDDACDASLGCFATDSTGDCDDNDACTTGDSCQNGNCLGGGALSCDDSNPCTDDACDIATGCTATGNTVPCDDGDACTVGDTCAAKACQPGKAADCDDSNPCTDDACEMATGCTATGNTVPCDDGDACTVGDTCAAKACQPGKSANCDDSNPCTDNACEKATGCTATGNTVPCDDGDACTVGDTCAAKACQPGKSANCDDGNPCTDDSCDKQAGCKNASIPLCVVPKKLPYFETFKCGSPSAEDWILEGYTDGPGWAIDATPGSITPKVGGCTLNYNNGTDYSCPAGVLSQKKYAYLPPLDLSAAKIPTVTFFYAGAWENNIYDDFALEASVDKASWSILADYNKLPGWTKSTLKLSAYIGTTVHLRFRFGTFDCVNNQMVGAFVDDLSVQDLGCSSDGACEDGNACTKDTCILASGLCTHPLEPNGAKCEDGFACTTNSCSAGTCQAQPVACDDQDACTTDDACVEGDNATYSCIPGVAKVCDDGTPCTTDSCDKQAGCLHVVKAGPCDDGDACTVGDSCADKTCQPGKAANCDDGNLCTDDSCLKLTGCQHVANQAPCDDGDACTVGDTCVDKACQPGKAVTCDDGKPCTTDSCDKVAGCVHTSLCDPGATCGVMGCTKSSNPACTGPHQVISDTSRRINFSSGSGKFLCDYPSSSLQQTTWYRFLDSGYQFVPETPPPTFGCGTMAPVWMSQAHPTVSQGVVIRKLCANWNGNLCAWSGNTYVVNCGGYFLYKVHQPVVTCSSRLCTTQSVPFNHLK